MTRAASPPSVSTPVGTLTAHPRGSTPDYRSWSAILMVFLGGAGGTVARESLDLITPTAQLIFVTFAINIVGSFALAVVYTVLLVGRDTAMFRRRARLLIGTGFMGGFTTYGSFAVATAAAASRGSFGDAALYAAGSVALGVTAALLGRFLVEQVASRYFPAQTHGQVKP